MNIILHAFMESFELASEMIRSVLLKEHWQHLAWDKTRDRDSSEGTMARDDSLTVQ